MPSCKHVVLSLIHISFGMNTQGDAATNRLIGQYKEQKNYAKVDECYKTLISIARKANNAGLVALIRYLHT